VALSEEYYADPVQVLGDVDEFLGVPRRRTSTGRILNAAEGAPLPVAVEKGLRDRFREPNEELARLIGRSLPWP